MKEYRAIAAAVTAGVTVLITVILLLAKLSVNPDMWPPHPNTTELVEIDEEFVDLFDPAPVHSNPSPAYAPSKQRAQSTPAEAGGTDLADAGEAASNMPDVTTDKPAPVQRPKKDTPQKTGPTRKEREAEEARRKARKGVSDAFKNITEEQPDNTQAKGPQKGNSGTPDGQASDLSGTGHGSVGGGWIMPRYAKVSAHQTGSIGLRAIVDREGKVASVELTGGKAPASGDPALVARCIAEVRRHHFTRNDDNAPERSIARIIYTFK